MHTSNRAIERQKKLFKNKNIWLSILIVSLPAFILGFGNGLFAFVDQLMMVKFIPDFLNIDVIFSHGSTNSWDQYYQLLQNIKNDPDKLKLLLNFNGDKDMIASMIRTAVAYSAPVTVFINAVSLLLGNGTAINYSKYNGAKNLPMAEKTWTQGFWANFILCIFITIIICAFCDLFVTLQQSDGLQGSLKSIEDSGKFTDSQFTIITNFYTDYYAQVKVFATKFIYVIGGTCALCIYSQFISYLVIAEGRQTFMVIISLICNGLNILLDYIFIRYAKMAMVGGATATAIGWFLNTLACFCYVYYLMRHNDTNLNLFALKKINFQFKEYGFLFALGLPSFVRNLSMAVATTIQMTLLVKVVNNDPTAQIADYQSVYGAVLAIYNLSFTALWGIVNGSRIVISYNYGCKDFKRVRWAYLVNVVYAVFLGIFLFVLVYCGIKNPLLSLFDISQNSSSYRIATKVLMISILQIPVMAISTGTMALFQATGRWWQASISAGMQGIVCSIPIIFLMQYVCIEYKNIDLFLWTPYIVAATATIINVIWGVVYMRLHFMDKHAKLNKR